MKTFLQKLLMTLLAPWVFLLVCCFDGSQRGFKWRMVQFWDVLKSIWLE